jgi:hypothetical protein
MTIWNCPASSLPFLRVLGLATMRYLPWCPCSLCITLTSAFVHKALVIGMRVTRCIVSGKRVCSVAFSPVGLTFVMENIRHRSSTLATSRRPSMVTDRNIKVTSISTCCTRRGDGFTVHALVLFIRRCIEMKSVSPGQSLSVQTCGYRCRAVANPNNSGQAFSNLHTDGCQQKPAGGLTV